MNLDLAASSNQIIDYHHLQKTTGSDGTVYYPSGAYYLNLYTVGGIAAMDNASPWKTGRNMNPTVDGRQRSFPPLKQWSDALFLIYNDFCGSDPVKMKKLKGVLRHNVVNTNAKQVLHEYMEKHGHLEDNRPKTWPGTEYNLGDDGFTVALGVPNGKGVAYLLATHRDALGWKEIFKIRIFSVGWASSYNILYYIRDHANGPSRRHLLPAPLNVGTNATITRDVALRVADQDVSIDQHKTEDTVALLGDLAIRHWTRAPSDTYDSSLMRGVMLQCRLHNDPESEPPSEWPDYGALDFYGWETAGGQEYRIEAGLATVYQDLGLSTAPAANLRHRYEHNRATEHDGREYPETDADFTNIFNVDGGAIIADLNMGSDYMIQKQTQQGITFSGEVVPLKQYSDVVFLAWQHAAGNKANGLKYIIRKGILNQETKDVVVQILQQRGVANQPWPGLKIPMSDRDALALLGSPNGRGAAWMLIQHKKELGWKSFSDVTIFANGRELCLCFWIQDVQAGGMELDLPQGLPGQSQGGPPKRSAVVSVIDTTSPSTSGVGGRLVRAISKRTDDVAKNLWSGLRLF
jgi:hypothetical protein